MSALLAEPLVLPNGRTVEVGAQVCIQKAPRCTRRWYVYTGCEASPRGPVAVLQPARNTVGGTRIVFPTAIVGVARRAS